MWRFLRWNPHCGSNLHFDIRLQAFLCDSCRSAFTFEPLEELVPTGSRRARARFTTHWSGPPSHLVIPLIRRLNRKRRR